MKLYSIMLLFLSALFFAACSDNLEEEVISQYSKEQPMVEQKISYHGDQIVVKYETRYYPNGIIEMEGPVDNNEREGEWVFYKEDGSKWRTEQYENGQLHGEFTEWYRSGKPKFEGEYYHGLPNGAWKLYTADGDIEKEYKYDKGKIQHE